MSETEGNLTLSDVGIQHCLRRIARADTDDLLEARMGNISPHYARHPLVYEAYLRRKRDLLWAAK